MGLDPAVARDLLEAARAVRRRAYAPYSKFRVGAALRGDDGRIYAGANVENASYGLTVCAERAAVAAAVAAGVQRIEAVAVVGDRPIPPCGACRQVIAEFGPAAIVIWEDGAGGYVERGIRELLPDPFKLAAE
ncbi:MAG: cytidine deaminase [Candidatus Coatesbacteria bacterium]|nr:MAG: cytidine deaminase [Candidatus Coatesbacteria bacterium]